jgi:hypothetical protein
MRTTIRSAVLAAALLGAVPTFAAPPAHYSTAETDIGTLLGDPAAKAVVAKYIPDFATNPQASMASAMTLRQVAPMSPTPITDQTLAKIDADLAKLPAKK